jgi:hypothetical protein
VNHDLNDTKLETGNGPLNEFHSGRVTQVLVGATCRFVPMRKR